MTCSIHNMIKLLIVIWHMFPPGDDKGGNFIAVVNGYISEAQIVSNNWRNTQL